jgi:ferritin
MGLRFLSFFCYKTTSINNLWKQLCAQYDHSSCSYLNLFLQDQVSKEKEEVATTIRER